MDIKDQPLEAQPSVPVVASLALTSTAQVQSTAPAQDTVSSAAPTPASAQATVVTPVKTFTEPAIKLNAIPTEEHQTAFRSHKSLIVGVILAAIVVVSGLSVFIGFSNSSSQYQGFLQKIEAETEKLNADKTSAENVSAAPGVPAFGVAVGGGDASGANSTFENDTSPKAALPEFGESTLSPTNLAPSSPDAEYEGVAR